MASRLFSYLSPKLALPAEPMTLRRTLCWPIVPANQDLCMCNVDDVVEAGKTVDSQTYSTSIQMKRFMILTNLCHLLLNFKYNDSSCLPCCSAFLFQLSNYYYLKRLNCFMPTASRQTQFQPATNVLPAWFHIILWGKIQLEFLFSNCWLLCSVCWFLYWSCWSNSWLLCFISYLSFYLLIFVWWFLFLTLKFVIVVLCVWLLSLSFCGCCIE